MSVILQEGVRVVGCYEFKEYEAVLAVCRCTDYCLGGGQG